MANSIAAFILSIVYLYIRQPYQVYGQAMEPAYKDGAKVLLAPKYYEFKDPGRDQIIMFKHPMQQDAIIISRVIAIPGDRVSAKEGIFYLNGRPLEETSSTSSKTNTDMQESIIGPEMYFVMGDNRDDSLDSRIIGPISKDLIIGKVTSCYANCK